MLLRLWPCVGLCLLLVLLFAARIAADSVVPASTMPWWFWPLALFVTCFLIGIVAVPAGIGGGTLFVPIIGGFFPFHLDFVRGAGLLVALASALAAGPVLLRGGLASVRLALPLALLACMSSIVGALLGLALPASVIQIALGLIVLGIVHADAGGEKIRVPDRGAARSPVACARACMVFLSMAPPGAPLTGRCTARRWVWCCFLLIGVMAGMFGIGAGWANVPALELADGRAAQGVCRHLGPGAVAGRFFGGLGLLESRRGAAHDCGARRWSA